MEKIQLEKLCKSGLSQREIGENLGVSTFIVGYWMRKYGIKNKSNFYVINKTSRACPACNQHKPISDFYHRFPDGSGTSPYCKDCTQDKVNERKRNFKLKCVEYKGGQCQICGYSQYISALEFHHRDPDKKDFMISKKSRVEFDDIKPELDKCDLLCCRCHREVHEKEGIIN